MQDFEVPRYKAAIAAFKEAFARGYAGGKSDLASGAASRPERDATAGFPIILHIPRNTILDDVWHPCCVLFEEAGRVAALSPRRAGEAELDVTQAVDTNHAVWKLNQYPFYVVDRG